MVTPAPRAAHWRLLLSLLRPHRRTVVVLGLVLGASAALPLVGPQLLRAFIDAAIDGAATARLIAIALAFIGLGLAAQGARVATAFFATRVAWAATNQLREDAAGHALRLDLAFHGAHPPGALVERVDGDATAITTFFTDVVIRVVGASATLAGAIVLVGVEDWRVGLAMAAFAALAVVVAIRLRDRAVPQATADRAAWADVLGLITEQLDGAEDLRAMGARDHALVRQEQAGAVQLRASVAAERAGAGIYAAMAGFFAVGGALMLLAGWLLLEADAITVGTVFLLFSYTQVLRQPVEQLADQLQEVQRAAAGAARMAELLAEVPTVRWQATTTLPAGPLDVRFDGVRFAYADRLADGSTVRGGTVLDGVDLHVPAGTVAGLVGASGSGKTTLARLALRLVDPTVGRVLVGGVDLRTVAHDDLRDRVAIVTQDVQILEGSVRDNLTLFAVDADDARLATVLGELGLGPWLAGLDAGLDTPLGVGGVPLSAGEAQLVGLARAFLRDPALVVLDEASSRVDPTTAEVVEAALDRLLAGRTALVIAHRLRAVDRADAVVVLDRGRVIEHGPRDALAADPSSRFAALLALETAQVQP